MASNTTKSFLKRRRRRTRAGKTRKRKERKKGTTPKFPIHK